MALLCVASVLAICALAFIVFIFSSLGGKEIINRKK